MPSLPARIVKALLKIQPQGWARATITEMRTRQEKQARWMRVSTNISLTPIIIDGNPPVQAAMVSAPGPTSGVMLYLHGGAYVVGSVNSHRALLSSLARVTRMKILAIDYRLAPEDPFPAALNDILTAYRWLLSTGTVPGQIVIAGDSAGGGLALAAIAALRDSGDQLPACALCFSPWLDLTLSSKSINFNAKADPLLSRAVLTTYADLYAGDHELSQPLISPFFADLEGFPPLLVHVGGDEIFLDEARGLAEAARTAGVDVELTIWPGLFHVFQLVPFLPEAKQSLNQAGQFIVHHLT